MTGMEHDPAREPGLEDLRAVDALFDRLASRTTTRDDRQDDLVTLLTSLTHEVDSRYPAVPAVEDLWLMAEGAELAAGDETGVVRLSAAGRHLRRKSRWGGSAAGGPRTVRLSTLAGVAAASAMIFTLGSLAIGDSPLGPLGWVGEVVSELNQDQEQQQVEQARVLVDKAWRAASLGDDDQAASLLRQAKYRLRGVEDPEADRVMVSLEQVETAIGPAYVVDSPTPTPSQPRRDGDPVDDRVPEARRVPPRALADHPCNRRSARPCCHHPVPTGAVDDRRPVRSLPRSGPPPPGRWHRGTAPSVGAPATGEPDNVSVHPHGSPAGTVRSG